MVKKRLVWVVVVIIFLLSILYISLNPLDVEQTDTLRAAIVDQLSVPQPNPEFVEKCESILAEAGFEIDYYGGNQVRVDFYRTLASHGYDLIILRVHSAINRERESTAFFTCEPYSMKKYVDEQLDNQVMLGKTSSSLYEGGPTYFVITSRFVRSSMGGRFDNTLIITTGCDSLVYPDMAEALVEKGASAYIGWRGLVMAEYTDRATISLLQSLITEKQTIEEAATNVWKEVGPDPEYNSVIQLYPPPENYTITIE